MPHTQVRRSTGTTYHQSIPMYQVYAVAESLLRETAKRVGWFYQRNVTARQERLRYKSQLVGEMVCICGGK